MATCIHCTSNLVYTQYIRVMRRNEKTHRSKQQFIPMSLICLDCKAIQWMLSETTVDSIRKRRVDINVGILTDTTH